MIQSGTDEQLGTARVRKSEILSQNMSADSRRPRANCQSLFEVGQKLTSGLAPRAFRRVYVLARTGKVYETWANLKPDAAEGDEILLRGAYIRDNVVLVRAYVCLVVRLSPVTLLYCRRRAAPK